MSKKEFVTNHSGASVLVGVRVPKGNGQWSNQVRGVGFIFYGEYVVTDAEVFESIPTGGQIFAAQVVERNGNAGSYVTNELAFIDRDETNNMCVLHLAA